MDTARKTFAFLQDTQRPDALRFPALRRLHLPKYFMQHIRTLFCNLNKRHSCAAWFTAALLPVLEGTQRDAKQFSETRL